jgi:hypothetical protein
VYGGTIYIGYNHTFRLYEIPVKSESIHDTGHSLKGDQSLGVAFKIFNDIIYYYSERLLTLLQNNEVLGSLSFEDVKNYVPFEPLQVNYEHYLYFTTQIPVVKNEEMSSPVKG